jgi:hypothetical protein
MSYIKDSMEIFICDECDTLASVLPQGNTITINKCKCLTLDWNENE